MFRNTEPTTLVEAKQKISAMDRAEEHPVYVADPDNPVYVEDKSVPAAADGSISIRPVPGVKVMKGYKSIFNKDTPVGMDAAGNIIKGMDVSIVGKDYTLIEHPEGFEPFADAMERLNITNIHARYEQTARYANIVYMIDDPQFVVVPKDGKRIWIGYRLSNGYDGLRALHYGTWLMRENELGEPDYAFAVSVPKNNGKVMNAVDIPHRGSKEAIIEAAQGYIGKVDEYAKILKEKVDYAIDVPVADDFVPWVLASLEYGPKSTPPIMAAYSTLPPTEQGNVWGVCLAIAKAAHDHNIERIGATVSERINKVLAHTAEVLDKAEELMLEDEAKARSKANIQPPAPQPPAPTP